MSFRLMRQAFLRQSLLRQVLPKQALLKPALLFASLALCLWPVAATGQIYVDKDSPSGGDGSSWSGAYNYLQDGLEAAGSGDQVWVAEGTYYPDASSSGDTDDRTATFELPSGAKVIGGFTGYGDREETSLTGRPERFQDAVTILSGEIQQDGDASNNAYHVATSRSDPSDTELRRVRITGGNANGRGEESLGGGVLLVGTDAKLLRSYVQKNQATRGAGIGIKRGAPALQALLVNENTASKVGGGVYDYEGGATVAYTTIAHNDASSGGGTFKVSSSTTWPNTHAYSNSGGNKTSEPADKLTVTLSTTVVGNDLYQDSDGDGLGYDDVSFHPENGTLDALTVKAGPVTKTIDMSSGSNTVNVPRSSDIDNLWFVQDDADFIDTWVMNDTENDPAPDLRKNTTDYETFPDPTKPDYQSPYDDGQPDQNSSEYNVLKLPAGELVSSYEARVIPARSPRVEESKVDGSRDEKWETYDNTIDEWQSHVSGQGGRWKEREVDGSTRKEVKTYIETGQSTYEQHMVDAYDLLRDIVPYPTASPQKVSSAPNEFNVNWTQEGSDGNNTYYDSDFIEKSFAQHSNSSSYGTAVSELYSALTGGYGTVQDDEPFDSISGGESILIKRKAAFPLRIQYSVGAENSGIVNP